MTDKNKEDLSVEKDFFEGGLEEEIDLSSFKSFRPGLRRNPYIAIAVIPVVAFLIYILSSDFMYGIRGLLDSKPKDLGYIAEALEKGNLKANRYVTGKGMVLLQSQLPVPKGKHKAGSVPASYNIYYILMGTENKVLVKTVSNSSYLTDKLPTVFTGRLMKLNDTKEGSRLKAYYKLNVKDPSVDIQFRQEKWSKKPTPQKEKTFKHNLEELKKGTYLFITDENKKFSPRGEFKTDIKVYFDSDYVISFSKKYKVTRNISVHKVVPNLNKCPCGAGRKVILKKTHGIISLPETDKLGFSEKLTEEIKNKFAKIPVCSVSSETTKNKDKDKNKGKDKKNSSNKVVSNSLILKPQIVEIPFDAVVKDSNGKVINFDKNDSLSLNVCQTTEKSETKILNLEFYPYEKPENCYRWLISKGYVFAETDAAGNTGTEEFEVVVRIPEQEALSIKKKEKIKRVCTPSKVKGLPPKCEIIYPPLSIEPRWKFIFGVPVKNIKVQGKDFIIRGAKTNYPKMYVPKQAKLVLSDGEIRRLKMLKPLPVDENYIIPLSYVFKFMFYPSTVIPDDAWIILTDEPPRTWTILWKIPIVIILLLILFANLRVLFYKFLKLKTA